MKLISNHELDQRSESELVTMFRSVSLDLVRTRRESAERRKALASLENISQARVMRMIEYATATRRRLRLSAL